MSPGDVIRSSPIQWVALAVATLGTGGLGVGIEAMRANIITNQQAQELGDKLDDTIKELGLVRKHLSSQAAATKQRRKLDAELIITREQHINLMAKSISRINGGPPSYGWPPVIHDNWEQYTTKPTHRTGEIWSE